MHQKNTSTWDRDESTCWTMKEGQGAHGGARPFPAVRTETGALGGRRPGGAPWMWGALQRVVGRGPFQRHATGTGGLQHLWSVGVLPRRHHGDGACRAVELGVPMSRHGDGVLQRACGDGHPPGGAPWGWALQRVWRRGIRGSLRGVGGDGGRSGGSRRR
jgi:hypothetical protein